MALSLVLLIIIFWIPPCHQDPTTLIAQGAESTGKLPSGKFSVRQVPTESKINILKQLPRIPEEFFSVSEKYEIWGTLGLLLILTLGIASLFKYFSANRKNEESCQDSSALSPISICSTSLPLIYSPISLDSAENGFISGLWCNEHLDTLTDNGTYSKNFEEKGLLWKNGEEMVYLARHKLDMEDYLVKKIPYYVSFENEFKDSLMFQEINKIKRINCRHVARYVTCWVEESTQVGLDNSLYNVILYIQMEFIQGDSLNTVFQDKVSKKAGLKIIRQVCKITDYLHTQGISHGDLSMGNIFIDRYNRVMIGDFNSQSCFCDDHRGLLELLKNFTAKVGKDESILKEILKNEFITKSGLSEKVAYIVRNS